MLFKSLTHEAVYDAIHGLAHPLWSDECHNYIEKWALADAECAIELAKKPIPDPYYVAFDAAATLINKYKNEVQILAEVKAAQPLVQIYIAFNRLRQPEDELYNVIEDACQTNDEASWQIGLDETGNVRCFGGD